MGAGRAAESGTGPAAAKPSIVVNADDFGRTGLANARIIHCFEQGLISSATLMANMPGYAEAVAWHRAQTAQGNRYRVGVHLNLIEGPALSRDFARLTGSETLFYPGNYLRCDPTYLEAARSELAAQVERVLADVEVSHFDSHHHLHVHWPVARIAVDLARRHGIGSIRLAGNILYPTAPHKMAFRWLINRYFQAMVGGDTRYFCSLLDYYAERPVLDGPAELMVHPELDPDFQLLTSPGYAEFLHRHALAGRP